MSKTSIPVSEAAVLTLLLEQPDISEQSYQELVAPLSGRAKEIAMEIRQKVQAGKTTKGATSGRAAIQKAPKGAKTSTSPKKSVISGKTGAKKAAAAKKISVSAASLRSARKLYFG